MYLLNAQLPAHSWIVADKADVTALAELYMIRESALSSVMSRTVCLMAYQAGLLMLTGSHNAHVSVALLCMWLRMCLAPPRGILDMAARLNWTGSGTPFYFRSWKRLVCRSLSCRVAHLRSGRAHVCLGCYVL